MEIKGTQIIAATGKKIFYKTDTARQTPMSAKTLLTGETLSDFVEIDEADIPTEELRAAIEEKIAEINAYDKSKSVEQFYLNGVPMWYVATKRTTIKNLINSSIEEGRDTVTLWTEEEPIVPITISCDAALQLLAKLEVYAGDALANTQRHKAAVLAMTDVEQVKAYDITEGYPEKLQLTF